MWRCEIRRTGARERAATDLVPAGLAEQPQRGRAAGVRLVGCAAVEDAARADRNVSVIAAFQHPAAAAAQFAAAGRSGRRQQPAGGRHSAGCHPINRVPERINELREPGNVALDVRLGQRLNHPTVDDFVDDFICQGEIPAEGGLGQNSEKTSHEVEGAMKEGKRIDRRRST